MNHWTVGRRLLSTFLATFVLILCLLGLYVEQTRKDSTMLNRVLHTLNKKVEIGNGIELATTEMQGAQRGLMLAYEAKDASAAPQYVTLYARSGERLDKLTEELSSLASSAEEQSALQAVRGGRRTWQPRFQELVEICASGEIAKAYALRNQNKVISAAMHAAAKSLVSGQEGALASAEAASAARLRQSLWMTAGAVLASLVLAVVVYLQVHQITTSLQEMVERLVEGAKQMAEGATQISTSSQVLAEGSSKQAASLGETSSASEQVSAMTQRNSESAVKASGLMRKTTELVEEANQSLEQMEQSMHAMNQSSTKVGNIIKIIDQIAFQTNILALNAAVEAARAGEAGMGFAVVADEVRNLAHRSAAAAKDTTALIEESMTRSQEGRAKLDLVAASIRAITVSSSEVKGLVDEVRFGSAEQSKGIQMIATQMGTIEKVTQRAAASAEEGAATGEEMRAQADSLNGIVKGLRSMVG
ncbi:MAG TPA: methyl-accepting chemotaxis protein [Granulicella sp.]|jgi:methyl-accepting chemotaxis protein/methyl-accepting chemotaxis protein-1 (serine sensor receptor)|nr:methyl-accepting chemotaxis protein [Granulicella sp.]